MRRATEISQDANQIETVEDLTAVFESLASTQVAKIKGKVELSKEFFNLVWAKYSSFRIDPNSRITTRESGLRLNNQSQVDKPIIFVVISAEEGLSGDIDQRLIDSVLRDYDSKTTDIIILGSHGAQQLQQRQVNYIRFFKIPQTESYVNVSPIVDAISGYKEVKVYYEEYVSLGEQTIKKIDLLQNIRQMSQANDNNPDAISDRNTIFEPSINQIAEIMENAMISLAFAQVILESSLAQDASRFNAMAVAKKRAIELVAFYNLEYHRSKRYDSDRRMREVIISLKRKKKERMHA